MTTPNDLHSRLSDPTRLQALTRAIRAKVPTSDVDDVVQTTLAEALTAAEPPADGTAFDRWLMGIARHKVADHYRRHRRNEVVDSDAVATSTHQSSGPESARDLLRWVDRELPKEPETTRTLEWMMREASGDRLESIAQEHAVPAPTVRQRVSRLRRYLRERWALEVAAALGLLVVVTGIFAYRQRETMPLIGPDPVVRVAPLPVEEARRLREAALLACRAGEWKPCIADLDRAKELDPAGDQASAVQSARIGAARALSPVPLTVPSSSAAPMPSAAPVQSAVPIAPVKRAPPVKSHPPVKPNQKQSPIRSAPLQNAPEQAAPQQAVPQQAVPQQGAPKTGYGKSKNSKGGFGGPDLDWPTQGK